ncbi:hypothetical protein D3H64_00570 [Atopobacter sp. AH10]|uniref:DMT family transporter n=1 Tax=Atopobacter sp. AH10 TaxID=2315861 RepID=UPI000EF1C7B9|nr:DMT family transporter [Atopobacter sp. AH10]RLK64059.1 hypothetical protein D3H64_00570 [Atopobacter sp. AH10]
MNSRRWGIILALMGSAMFGLSSLCAQVLFDSYQAGSEWLVSIRLLISGFCVLVYSALFLGDNIFVFFKSPKDVLQMLAYSILGMASAQYCFFKGIEVSGAALVTIVQFMAPVFVYLYLVLTKEKDFLLSELFFVLSTVAGVALIVTNGDLHHLNMSLIGVFLSLMTGVCVAFYTVQPRHLLAEYCASTVIGWGMFLGGLAFQLVHPIYKVEMQTNMTSLILLAFVIVVGTAMAFITYTTSLKYIDPSMTSILSAVQPLLVTVLSAFIFKEAYGWIEMLGTILVVGSVIMLTRKRPDKKKVSMMKGKKIA